MRSYSGLRQRGNRLGTVGLGLALAAGFAGICGAQPGSPQVVERVVAVVDEEPILLTELQAQYVMAAQAFGVDLSDSVAARQLRDEILEQQIDQRVLYLEAQAQGVIVDETEIDQLVDEAIARNRSEAGSEEAFQMQLQREGLTEEDLRQRYREQARRELIVSRFVQREIRSDITVTPAEVRAYFEQHRSELPQREAGLHLQRIVIQVKPDPALYEKARDLAAQVRDRIASGAIDFADAARRYSDDPNGRTGGDLRRVSRGDFADRLGPAFEDSLFALEAGDLSRPLRSPLGYHLVLVEEKALDGSWIHPRHILFGVPVVQADRARAELLADQLYDRLKAGESFEALAREHSDDPVSREEGGDLGWVPVSALGETIRGPIDSLQVGEISRPVTTESEVQIFRVLGRESARDFAFKEIEEELTEIVRTRKLEERYQSWVEELKEKHYIERRSWDAN